MKLFQTAWARLRLNWNRWNSIGRRGERRAARYLRENGYRIVARNWRNPRDRRDEIDLVCWKHETLIFVEVKTRSPTALVTGVDTLDPRKRRVLRRAVRAYLRQLAPRDRPRTFRLDVVALVSASAEHLGRPTLQHFENIPLFSRGFTYEIALP